MIVTLHSDDGCLNFTLWNDSNSCLFADNDFPAKVGGSVARKIHDKKKGVWSGLQKYLATLPILCYQRCSNDTDIRILISVEQWIKNRYIENNQKVLQYSGIHNQFCSYGNWDFKTQRKQNRVILILYFFNRAM